MTTETRPAHIHQARVYLAQAAARRNRLGFHATLLHWAANARKRAANIKEPQGRLFA